MQYPPNPGHHHQEAAEPLPHDGHIVKWLADGHIVVIGHDNEEDDLWASQEVLHKQLRQAAAQRDGSPLVQEVDDHFGGGDTGVEGIYERQACEKEVHGSWKCGTEANGNSNEQIGQNSE